MNKLDFNEWSKDDVLLLLSEVGHSLAAVTHALNILGYREKIREKSAELAIQSHTKEGKDLVSKLDEMNYRVIKMHYEDFLARK